MDKLFIDLAGFPRQEDDCRFLWIQEHRTHQGGGYICCTCLFVSIRRYSQGLGHEHGCHVAGGTGLQDIQTDTGGAVTMLLSVALAINDSGGVSLGRLGISFH